MRGIPTTDLPVGHTYIPAILEKELSIPKSNKEQHCPFRLELCGCMQMNRHSTHLKLQVECTQACAEDAVTVAIPRRSTQKGTLPLGWLGMCARASALSQCNKEGM